MTILLISPPSPDRSDIIAAVEHAAHEVTVVDSAAEAPTQLASGVVELLIVDLAGGAEVLRFLRKYRGEIAPLPIICVTDRRLPDASSDALRIGVADIVARPVRADDVIAAIANACELTQLPPRAGDAPDTPDPTEGVFGASAAMRDVLAIVRRVAPSRCGVLLIGERGTGREMVARAIHSRSPGRDRPFVSVRCGDPDGKHLHRLLACDVPEGSTVFLEEIADLPPDRQAQLETFVRNTDAGPVGASPPAAPIRFSVRMVAAAQPRLSELVERGRVRPGLIESIGVVRIELPSLRQRAEDVPLLATHFLKEACRNNDIPAKTFSRSALTLLAALPWPGNAVELRSLTERLAVLVPRGVVVLEDVLANIRLDGAEALGRPRESLRVARERFEREYVTAVLQHHKGRMGEAARDLGIERTNLYRKIKQLNIRWTIFD